MWYYIAIVSMIHNGAQTGAIRRKKYKICRFSHIELTLTAQSQILAHHWRGDVLGIPFGCVGFWFDRGKDFGYLCGVICSRSLL